MSRWCTRPSGPARSSAQLAAHVNDSLANSLAAAPSVPGRRPDAATHAARPVSRSATSLSIARRTSRSRVTGSSIARSPSAFSRCVTVIEHAEEALAVTHTTGEPTLERQRDEHDLPATVDLTDAPLVADAHVVEEGDVDALAGERAHLLEADPGRVHRHQEEREAGVLRTLGAGAGEEEDPVGFLGDAGEHLLAVDAPVVAVAHGAGSCRGHIRTRIGLGVAQAHHRVARQQARQHLGADHLVAHVREHRRHHHHVAQARRRARPSAPARRTAPPALPDRVRRLPALREVPGRSNRVRRSPDARANCGSCPSRGPARAPRR